MLHKDLVETDCSENYPSRNIDENYPNGHSYQTNWPCSSMIMNWYQNQYFPSILCVCYQQSFTIYPHNFPILFRFHMSIQILSNVLKIEAPMMHHIIFGCWNYFFTQILGFLYHKWTYGNNTKFSGRNTSVYILYIFIPSLNIHTVKQLQSLNQMLPPSHSEV